MITIQRPIVFFDVETTGLSVAQDRIIELAMIKVMPNGEKEQFYSLVNPEGKECTAEAVSKHGLTAEKLADAPTFREIAQKVMDFIANCDLGGFNCTKFDIPLLVEELLRAGIHIKSSSFKIVDVYKILVKADPRTLEATYKRFMGKPLEGAHGAMADIIGTIQILEKMEQEFEIPTTTAELHEFQGLSSMVDYGGKFKYENEEIKLNFGKYRGQTVKQVWGENRGYFSWLLGTDLTTHTKIIIQNIIKYLELDGNI